jgi:hypothetical protein
MTLRGCDPASRGSCIVPASAPTGVAGSVCAFGGRLRVPAHARSPVNAIAAYRRAVYAMTFTS